MINITFTGNIYHSDGTPAQDVKYQGLFIKVNPNSSDSVWDTPRISETNQYNFNLGDNSWLSQQGGYGQPYDRVVLCFWVENIEDRDSVSLQEWAFIEWELDERDVYVQNIQLQGQSAPTCSFAVSGSNPLSIYDTGTTEKTQWIFEGKEHYQSQFWDGYEIFQMNRLDGDVVIDWGDTNTLTYPLSSSPYEHQYNTPNDYNIEVFVSNINGLSCSETFTHRIYNMVENGLTWGTPIYLGVSNRYTPDITGNLPSIFGVDYYIDGVLTHENFTYNQTFDHTFTGEGNHRIRQCIKYDDGYTSQIQCQDYDINLDTRATYVSSDYECGIMFTDTSNIGTPPTLKYQWDVSDGLLVLAHVEGTQYDDWYYSWPYKGTFHVRMAITDGENREYSVTKEYIVDQCIGKNEDMSGFGGGGSSPWVFSETKYQTVNQKLPAIQITDVEDCDEIENKRILILEVIDMDKIL